MYGNLTGHGPEGITLDTVDIADVGLLEVRIGVFPDGVAGDVNLDAALQVLNVGKRCLPHDPLEHHAAGDRYLHGIRVELFPAGVVGFLLRLAKGGFCFLVVRVGSSGLLKFAQVRLGVVLQDFRFLLLVEPLHVVRVVGLIVGRDLEGVLAGLLQGLQLVKADLPQLVNVLLCIILILVLFCHNEIFLFLPGAPPVKRKISPSGKIRPEGDALHYSCTNQSCLISRIL